MWFWNRYELTDFNRRSFEAWGAIGAFNLQLGSEFYKAQARFSPFPAYADGASVLSAQMNAAGQMLKNQSRRYDTAPPFDIPGAREKNLLDRPFYKLTRFETSSKSGKPKLLIVAPMSGHYASLLRSTVEGMMPGHDVHIIDWKNPRDVPLSEGVFDFEKYMESLHEAMEHLGPNTHVMGISQSTVPLLAVSAYMAQNKNPAVPASMTLIGGPIDTRKSQSKIHDFARNVSDSHIKTHISQAVPGWYKGKGRRVYPGFTQLMALTHHSQDQHSARLSALYGSLVEKDAQASEEFQSFFKGYLAVMDLDEAFFIDTLRHVYKDHSLAKGTMTFRGTQIDFGALKTTALMTIEGAQDTISLPGETHAAHDICPNIPTAKRRKFTHPEYGHYGIALGPRFQRDIAPRITSFIKGKKSPPAFKPK